MDSSPNAQGDSNSPYVTAVQRYFSTMIKVQRGCKTTRPFANSVMALVVRFKRPIRMQEQPGMSKTRIGHFFGSFRDLVS